MKGCLVSEKLKIGVLLSGSGTNFQAILDEAEKGLPVEVVKVVASRPDAYGIERANAAGIPVLVMNREKYADPKAADVQIVAALQGAHAIADAFNAGVKVTGVTVHFANEDYDKGPIVAQEPVRVGEGDTLETLEAHIHQVEHELYPRVLGWLAAGRVSVDAEGKVHLAE